ncbi:hypothetical protein N8K70_10490 [Microbacterium betulae]|uniref:PKD domain-containing protein n=1 Tax=Microbacterium betulae TaxID=2981139 RepID=A0AA97I5R1_9MICO|nr:hypothetical protein [Microbacterium sp. AB]WOF21812.1 hypothetical protein N8K70_10490 [Microbacterium sp. AB]
MVSTCTPEETLIGLCSETRNEGDHVEIEAEHHRPGSEPPQRAPYRPIDDRDSDAYDEGGGSPGEGNECRVETLGTERLRCFLDRSVPEEEEDPPEAPVIPPIGERDVLAFAPAPLTVATEPDGVAVVGMPMNVVAPAQEHVAGGSLFGLPVRVVFTPASFAFDFGDGTVRTSSSGGSSWSDQGLPEFSATATSHAYASRGTYTVVASVSYNAVVDFGVWGAYPVDGLVTTSSPASSVRVVEAHTALVERSCIENPAGPGC